MSLVSEVEFPFCACGCGQRTYLSPRTYGNTIRKGEPLRYLPKHNGTRTVGDGDRLDRFIVEDRGHDSPCHVWQGPHNGKGYGLVKIGRSSGMVHKVIYEGVHGPVPPGWTIDHLCRIRDCLNVDHLEAVPHAVNVRRGANQKLTEDDVKQILITARTTPTISISELARQFDVTRPTIREVLSGRHWMAGAAIRSLVTEDIETVQKQLF